MYRLICLIAIVFLSHSCFEESMDLPSNPFENEDLDFIEITSFEYDNFSGELRIRYEKLINFSGNEKIAGIAVFKNGEQRGVITDLSQDLYFESGIPINQEFCYELAYLTVDNELLNKSNQICFET